MGSGRKQKFTTVDGQNEDPALEIKLVAFVIFYDLYEGRLLFESKVFSAGICLCVLSSEQMVRIYALLPACCGLPHESR